MSCTNDAAIKTELDHVELSRLSYSRTPFNPSTLQFSGYPQPESGLISYDVPLDLDILLKYLPPSSLSAKQFEYRAEGYKVLLASLRGLQCSSKLLEFRRVDLINTISAELGGLLATATQELKTQASMGTHYDGLHRIHFDRNKL
ncbi:hypothetical protein FRC09_016171 [Ceratobasidium sp. 395]|nr:hypothetical protein FRC09_016171 [Ceratobasidium sp. 395]